MYLIHRWIGIVSCLFFAMWFISGLVMIYVPYPSLSQSHRLAGAQAIEWAAVDVQPPLTGGYLPKHLSLEMRDGLPVWRIEGWDGIRNTVAGARGKKLPPVDAVYAARVAGQFSHVGVAAVDLVERDQWTVAGGFDRHRPLWKAQLADDAGTEVYVSSSTGAIVQRTTRHERFWNWLGSIPHWLYPTILREDGAAWRQVVMWVSGPCIAAAVAGIWIGILRTRLGRRRFKGGRVTPYHGWMLWHHIAGMAGGLFLLGWIFSGWLSVDPGRVFQGSAIEDGNLRHYAGADLIPALPLHSLNQIGKGAKRVDIIDNAGAPMLIVYRNNSREILSMQDLRSTSLAPDAIVKAARRLVPAGHIVSVDRLTKPDAYWYAIGEAPKLPILRIRFDDPAQSWLHIDPATGELLGMLDCRQRIYRWLFDLLHKWDLNVLISHRPLWDALLWIFSALGLVTSVSGIWIGWRRLRRHHVGSP
jgi:hypothetical protein